MKKQNLLLVLLLAATQLFAQVPTNGLVGYFPFNGNPNDLSTTNNNGFVSGASLTTDRLGNPNSAYSFNGTTDFIRIPHNNIYNNQTYTVSFWYKFSTPSTPGSGGFNVNPGIISKVASLSTVTYDNWIFYEALTLVGFASGGAGGSGIGGTPIGQNDGQWRHIVVSVASDSIRTYLNGQKVGSTLKGSNLVFNNQDIYLGRSNASYWKAFQGSIDELAIYNTSLTATEIIQLFNGCTNTTATITPNDNTTFCQGSNVVLEASEGTSYNWSNGASTQSITVTQGNTYTVTVTDGNSCTASASQVVTVNPIPSVSFTLPTITNIGAPSFIMNASPSGGVYSGAGVTSNEFNPAQAGLGNKQVEYSLTDNNGCSNSLIASTLVYDTTGILCTTRDTITTTIFDTLTSIVYDTTNVAIYDTFTTTIYDTITTTINDTVTTFVSVTDTLLIDVTITSLTPPNNTNTVKVYPNPTRDALFINNGNLASMAGYSIKITNSLGQIFFNEPVNQQQFFIDISTWATGTYLLYVINPQQAVVETKQVVLQ